MKTELQLTDKSRSVAISAHWLDPCSLFRFYPWVFVSIEYSELTMVLFAIVSSKYIKSFVVKSCCVIFYLRRTLHCIYLCLLLISVRKRLELVWCLYDWLWDESPRKFNLLLKVRLVLFLVVAAVLAANGTLSVNLVSNRSVDAHWIHIRILGVGVVLRVVSSH